VTLSNVDTPLGGDILLVGIFFMDDLESMDDRLGYMRKLKMKHKKKFKEFNMPVSCVFSVFQQIFSPL